MFTKKYIKWILTTIFFISLLSCGKKSSKEGKELLERILQIIGIPHDIIVNVCQDSNQNSFCDKTELQQKMVVTIDKGQIMWEKITRGGQDGEYILETKDDTIPILLELQDINRVHYNDGKFTLSFSGLEGEERKELSVLQSMVDKDYLSEKSANSVRNLGNPYAQDKFYEYLFEGFERNLNTLAEQEIQATEAVDKNINEMANRLIDSNITQELPLRIAECTDNECIDRELNVLTEILSI